MSLLYCQEAKSIGCHREKARLGNGQIDGQSSLRRQPSPEGDVRPGAGWQGENRAIVLRDLGLCGSTAVVCPMNSRWHNWRWLM